MEELERMLLNLKNFEVIKVLSVRIENNNIYKTEVAGFQKVPTYQDDLYLFYDETIDGYYFSSSIYDVIAEFEKFSGYENFIFEKKTEFKQTLLFNENN